MTQPFYQKPTKNNSHSTGSRITKIASKPKSNRLSLNLWKSQVRIYQYHSKWVQWTTCLISLRDNLDSFDEFNVRCVWTWAIAVAAAVAAAIWFVIFSQSYVECAIFAYVFCDDRNTFNWLLMYVLLPFFFSSSVLCMVWEQPNSITFARAHAHFILHSCIAAAKLKMNRWCWSWTTVKCMYECVCL